MTTVFIMDADELDMLRCGILEIEMMRPLEEDIIMRHVALNGRRRAM
jgi:hypothetical protein